jgi:hypothetical protein
MRARRRLHQNRNNYTDPTAWSDGGGGKSSQITIPSYQSAEKKVKKVVGKTRGVPDFTWDANPNSGVAIYDSTPYEGETLDWLTVGGTSVSSPSLAATINAAGSFAASTVAELTSVYAGYTNTANWTDVTSGSCGTTAPRRDTICAPVSACRRATPGNKDRAPGEPWLPWCQTPCAEALGVPPNALDCPNAQSRVVEHLFRDGAGALVGLFVGFNL